MHTDGTRAPARRLIDLTEDDLDRKLEEKIAALLEDASSTAPLDPERALTRSKTAELLGVSLTQLDLLSRRERPDPIPFRRVGESRRYIRSDVLAWLRRQGGAS